MLEYTGLSSDERLPTPLEPDHEVDLEIRPREGSFLPEFFFEPTGLFVERGDVVKFRLATPDHTVTAYHPELGRQRRVPEGVEPFSSPVLAGETFWLYRFDEPGVYDLLCAPHEIFGMVMRVVVEEPGTDFGDEGRPPELTAALVFEDPALEPENIETKESVSWGDLQDESKQVLVEFNEPPEPEVVTRFEDPKFPENLTVDARGNLYLSMALAGEIRKITPNRKEWTVATIDLGEGGGDIPPLLLGVAVNAHGMLYAVVASFDGGTHGIWRIPQNDSGEAERIVELPLDSFPNDLILDCGSLLVTDSARGAVWRIESDKDDGWEKTEWLQNPLFEPNPDVDIPVGANGIAKSRDGSLVVANTDYGRIVRIPVEEDGSAGTPEKVVENEELAGADGIALDVVGNVYVAVNDQNKIARVTREGGIETVATAEDGVLDFPSDLVFGTTPDQLETLFVTNFAFGPGHPPQPSLVSIEVSEPGLPTQY